MKMMGMFIGKFELIIKPLKETNLGMTWALFDP